MILGPQPNSSSDPVITEAELRVLDEAIDYFYRNRDEFLRYRLRKGDSGIGAPSWDLLQSFVLKKNQPFNMQRYMASQAQAIRDMLASRNDSPLLPSGTQARQGVVTSWIQRHAMENRQAEVMFQMHCLRLHWGEFLERMGSGFTAQSGQMS